MDALGLSSAAAPVEVKPQIRPVDAKPPTTPAAAAAEDARVKALAPAAIPQKTQLLVEQVDRFRFAYTFVNSDTGEVVSKWPTEDARPQAGVHLDAKL